MFDNKKQDVLTSANSKTTFILGVIIGALLLGTVSFFILLAVVLSDEEDQANQQNLNTNSQPTVQATLPQPSATNRVEIQITSADHLRGSLNAPVKIVEFSDYQCPFCKRHHPTMQQITAEYSDQVAWIYKHFPLDSIHPQARPAAEASECIWEQKSNEGFWQFTDQLFENQERLGNELYTELAQELGVNNKQFQDCLGSRKYQQKVEADYQEGLKAGVTGTPGNFVNGLVVKGALPFSSFKQVIDSELSK